MPQPSKVSMPNSKQCCCCLESENSNISDWLHQNKRKLICFESKGGEIFFSIEEKKTLLASIRSFFLFSLFLPVSQKAIRLQLDLVLLQGFSNNNSINDDDDNSDNNWISRERRVV